MNSHYIISRDDADSRCDREQPVGEWLAAAAVIAIFACLVAVLR
jgi:hypothetical protein